MATKKKKKRHKKANFIGNFYFDNTMLLCVLLLLLFGLVILYSTSSYSAALQYHDAAFFLKKQLYATILGLVVMVIVSKIDYHILTKFAFPIYVFSLILVVLIIPFGSVINGAKRWIKVAGISIQPAEVVKLALIIMLANYIRLVGTKIRNWDNIFAVGIITAVPTLMIYGITRNLSSAVIVLGIAAVMLFVSDNHYKRYFVLLGAAVAVAGLYVLLVLNSKGTGFFGFRGGRIKAWVDPEGHAATEGFQTLQALYAIGSGGIVGKGLGQSMQKLGFLPEAQNDMVFSIICEELGLFGAVCVIVLFGVLIYRFMVVASNAPDLTGAMLVVGVFGHIAIQVILNIAVVTNTIPNTGITLPFISYGGTSILFLLIEMGIVLNVSSKIHLRDIE